MSDGPASAPAHIHSQCPFISVLLCVLFSATVVITSRSSSILDSKAAALHFINLSLLVQLGERDKLGKPWRSVLLGACRIHAWEGDEEEDGRHRQSLMQVNLIREE